VDVLRAYLSWRRVLTVNGFWIAVLKLLPYEVTTAYGVVMSGYATSGNQSTVGWLFFAICALSVAVFFLHRSTTGASVATAIAMAILFLLFALAMRSDVFRPWLIDGTITMPPMPTLFNDLIRPFPILVLAVLLVLTTAGLRKVLA
jgi:hypothetical protein